MSTAIRALLAGPTPQEREAGYVSNFGSASANIDFRVRVREDSVAVADFDPAITKIPMAFVTTMESAQIVATLAQFPGIKRVMILIAGQPFSKAVSQ
jgi:spore germination protein GerM